MRTAVYKLLTARFPKTGGGRGTDNRKQLRGWNRLLAQEQRRSDYPCYVLAPQTTRLWDGAHLEKIKEVVASLPSVDMDDNGSTQLSSDRSDGGRSS